MTGPVSAVAVSADGDTVAAATSRAARTWVRGRLVASRTAPPGTRFTAAGVSPSGTYAAFAAFPDLEVLGTAGRSWRQARLHGFGTWHRGRPPLVTNLAVPSDSGLVVLDGRYGSWRRLALPGLTVTGSARNTFGPSRYPAYTYALSPGGTLFTHSYVAAGSSLRVLSTRRPGPAGHARPGGRLALALAISRDGRWIASEDASGIHVSRIARAAQPAGAPRTYPGAEPLFSTSLAFAGPSDTRLVSASGNLVTLWNLAQYSRIGRAARIPMPWRCGRVCPGPRLAIQPGGREAALTDSNGDRLLRAGLGASFGTVTTIATGRAGEFGLPLWSRTGNRLYLAGPHAVGRQPRREGACRRGPGEPRSDPGSGPLRRRAPAVHGRRVRDGPDRPRPVRPVRPIRPIRHGPAGPAGQGGAVIQGPPGIRPNAGLYQRQAAVSPSGTRAAVIDQSDQEVYVVNLKTGRIWRVPGVKAYELAYSGSRLVLQRENGDIDLRGADGTRVIRSVQGGTPWNYGNIAVSPGPAGQVLVAGERADGRGVLADVGSGHLLGVFPIAKASPYQQTTMAFTPGGRSLVTVTEGNSHADDGVLTQLSLVPAQWIKVACTTSGHSLTAQAWRRYISPTPPAELGCGR